MLEESSGDRSEKASERIREKKGYKEKASNRVSG